MQPIRPLPTPTSAPTTAAGTTALPPRKVCTQLDDARYERLKAYAARNRLTGQDVLIRALDLLLAAA